MDTMEAMDYLKKMHAEPDSQPGETTSTEDTAATGGQVSETKTPVPEPEENTARETVVETVPEISTGKNENPTPAQQKKPSKQEKINHAFQREKARHKEQLDAANKRIAELEEKVKKYSVLEQGDFDPNDVKSYIDHKFALEQEQGELASLKKQRDQMVNDAKMKEASARHEQQVNECFADDTEREHYWTLLRNGGGKFREFLDTYDDGTIDSFIGDSDVAPFLISALMRNPETLKSIVEKRNPMRKMIALQTLENRLKIGRRLSVGKQNPGTEKTTQTPKLPIIGSQVQNPGGTSETAKKDWNRYLIEHPFGS